MSQELTNCHEVLGVAEGASPQELKVAYRDLAKVWHPDRFAHDPRLQQKAQEKLKEINEAYEQLTSGKIRFQKRRSGETQPHPTSGRAQSHTQQNTPRAAWQLAVLPVCVFAFVLLVAGSLLIARREPVPQNPSPEVETGNAEQPIAERASETVQEQQRADRKPRPKPLSAEAMKEPRVEQVAAAKLTPLPTVTLTIDPTTGLIATTHCPLKSRVTYADGTEPQQHCSLHQTDKSAPADPSLKESRLKSLTKRLAAPTRWFRGKEKSDSAQRETPASHNTGQEK
jgi:curved DNA-binding protein CbpA